MKKVLSLLIVVMLIGAVSVSGQAIGDLKGKMAAGAFINFGIGFGDQFKSTTAYFGGYSVTAKNKLQGSIGGQFLYGVAPKIAVKGILDYQKEKYEITGSHTGLTASSTYHILEISANGMYFFSPEKRLCPFVEAGPGMYSFGGSGSSSSTKIGVNAGVGGDYLINEKFAIDGGARFHIVFTDIKNTTYLDIHAGVSYFFGAKK
jgi:hypothetical protein